jgi:hypothetical protein
MTSTYPCSCPLSQASPKMRLPRLREINRVVAFDDCTGRI